MTTHPNMTLYIKMGIVGLAEEAQETLTFTFDPSLSPEELQANFQLEAQLFQLRFNTQLAELFLKKVPAFMEAKAEEEGWELPTGGLF